MMFQETISEAMKWGLLVFAAGFIGFFGKYLGRIVLAKLHKEKGPDGKAPAPSAPGLSPGQEAKSLKKAEKIRQKSEKKQAKKASGEEEKKGFLP